MKFQPKKGSLQSKWLTTDQLEPSRSATSRCPNIFRTKLPTKRKRDHTAKCIPKQSFTKVQQKPPVLHLCKAKSRRPLQLKCTNCSNLHRVWYSEHCAGTHNYPDGTTAIERALQCSYAILIEVNAVEIE